MDTATMADVARQMRSDYPTEPTADELLEAASDQTLLTTFAALTHRIHAREAKNRAYPFADNLRAQRDTVQAEILRRMAR